MKKLFVGSLAWATDDDSLRAFFEQFGTVAKAEVVRERDSGRSRGFGFVEFEDDDEADKAIAGANDQELDGRNITVSESKPRPEGERPPRRDNGGSRGGYGGGRGGYGGGRDNRSGGNNFRQRSW
ncbi:RNA-binding protein [Candidatus Saccharibacteria bacterium]|nr:RNA-binding protein [Candidatus Saccharibacteria bacterium]MCL1962725.1 RNA-binding protein [Candidatus Saccharibacteria bacterium]